MTSKHHISEASPAALAHWRPRHIQNAIEAVERLRENTFATIRTMTPQSDEWFGMQSQRLRIDRCLDLLRILKSEGVEE